MSLPQTPQDVLALDKRPDRDRIEATARRLRAICLSQKRPADALSAARVYARYCTTNIPSWLEDVALEEALYARFCSSNEVRSRFEGAAFVATALHDVGGHSKWGLAFLKALAAAGRAPSVVITSTISKTIRQQVEALGVEVFVPDRWDDLLTMEVSGELYLCIANDDIVSALLAQRMAAAGRRIIFCNHTDHTFSLGAVRTRELIEVSGFGYELSQRGRTFTAQSFAGIPIKVEQSERGSERSPASDRREEFRLLTIGRSGKLKPSMRHNFADFAVWVVRNLSDSYLIIGRTGLERWWGDRLKDTRIDRRPGMGWDEIETLLPGIDAYIDSFPLTGGTVLSEIALTGLPIFGIKDIPRGWSAADSVMSEDVEHLQETLLAFRQEGQLPYDPAALRQLVVKEHSQEVFESRVRAFLLGDPVPLPEWARQSTEAIDSFREVLAASEFAAIRFEDGSLALRIKHFSVLARKQMIANQNHLRAAIKGLIGLENWSARTAQKTAKSRLPKSSAG